MIQQSLNGENLFLRMNEGVEVVVVAPVGGHDNEGVVHHLEGVLAEEMVQVLINPGVMERTVPMKEKEVGGGTCPLVFKTQMLQVKILGVNRQRRIHKGVILL